MAARILVIEDNPTNLELMMYLLEAYGYVPLTARDGLEGVESAIRERPDLIICDVQLPKIDGFEVARRLKKQPGLRNVPLVAVTALAMVGDRERLLSAGFDGYVAKPMRPETFVPEMEAFLAADLRAPERRRETWIEAATDPQPQAGSRGSVLVVDDNAANRMLMESILEPHGYAVIAARSLAQAQEEVRRARPDLILSDVHLGDGNAIEFLRLLRSEARLQSIPVLLQSASVTELERKALRELGTVKLLGRPMEALELLAEVEAAFLSIHGAGEEA